MSTPKPKMPNPKAVQELNERYERLKRERKKFGKLADLFRKEPRLIEKKVAKKRGSTEVEAEQIQNGVIQSADGDLLRLGKMATSKERFLFGI